LGGEWAWPCINIISRVAIVSIIERKRVFLQAYRLAHLSVCLSVYPEDVPWQNGSLDLDAVWLVSGVGRGMGVLDMCPRDHIP